MGELCRGLSALFVIIFGLIGGCVLGISYAPNKLTNPHLQKGTCIRYPVITKVWCDNGGGVSIHCWKGTLKERVDLDNSCGHCYRTIGFWQTQQDAENIMSHYNTYRIPCYYDTRNTCNILESLLDVRNNLIAGIVFLVASFAILTVCVIHEYREKRATYTRL